MSRNARTQKKEYDLVNSVPVARFYYKGTHSHPIRRTILVIEENDTLLTGYEVRTGKCVKPFNEAPIRSYRKDKIAKYGDYSRLKKNIKTYMRNDTETTLQRTELVDLVRNGA